MQITVNGNRRDVHDGCTLQQLVERLALKGDRIATERNLEVVPRAKYDETILHDGDRLEIVTFVGGG